MFLCTLSRAGTVECLMRLNPGRVSPAHTPQLLLILLIYSNHLHVLQVLSSLRVHHCPTGNSPASAEPAGSAAPRKRRSRVEPLPEDSPEFGALCSIHYLFRHSNEPPSVSAAQFEAWCTQHDKSMEDMDAYIDQVQAFRKREQRQVKAAEKESKKKTKLADATPTIVYTYPGPLPLWDLNRVRPVFQSVIDGWWKPDGKLRYPRGAALMCKLEEYLKDSTR